MLFAVKKETEEDITRRVSRRVERYLEKLKTLQHSVRTNGASFEQHSTPELPSEFEDDAPTLIVRARNQAQSQLPLTLAAQAKTHKVNESAEAVTEPALSAAAVRSQFGERVSERKPEAGAQKPLVVHKGAIKVVSNAVQSETEPLASFGLPGDSDFEKFQTESVVDQEKLGEDSLDLGRFAEVSRYALNEKKPKKSGAMPAMGSKQLESLPEPPAGEAPSVFLASRATIVVFSILGIAILAVLYFLLAFDKYVY